MPSFRVERPMCNRPDEVSDEDRRSGFERHNGTDFKVTRYSDGTSTVHHGGPCGDTHYDENGEEC